MTFIFEILISVKKTLAQRSMNSVCKYQLISRQNIFRDYLLTSCTDKHKITGPWVKCKYLINMIQSLRQVRNVQPVLIRRNSNRFNSCVPMISLIHRQKQSCYQYVLIYEHLSLNCSIQGIMNVSRELFPIKIINNIININRLSDL